MRAGPPDVLYPLGTSAYPRPMLTYTGPRDIEMAEQVTLQEDLYEERALPGGGTTRVLVGRAGQTVDKADVERARGGEVTPLDGSPHRGSGGEDVPEPSGNASTEEWRTFARAAGGDPEVVNGMGRNELRETFGSDG